MKATRGMDPQGLKARWAAGAHQQAAVSLQAEQFCLACHVKAQVGEVLGTVTVRSDLARKEAVWWQEVRPTAGALSLKNLAHIFLPSRRPWPGPHRRCAPPKCSRWLHRGSGCCSGCSFGSQRRLAARLPE